MEKIMLNSEIKYIALRIMNGGLQENEKWISIQEFVIVIEMCI